LRTICTKTVDGPRPDLPADRTLFLLPVIIGYTAWSYWVFRGKVHGGHG